MSKEYFTENISAETLAQLIDETINYEKSIKNKKIPVGNIIKIVSVAAALVLFIGFLNFLPMIINFDDNNIAPANSNEITSGENTDKPEIDQSGLFIPDAIEKSFFEEKILNSITNKAALNKILAYYTPIDSLYVLAANTSTREKNQLLDYLLEYTDITADDMLQMCIDNNISLPKKIDPAYSHVRFGKTEDILLLDIEWYTYETYFAYMESRRTKQYQNEDDYINSSDEEKAKIDKLIDEFFQDEEYLKGLEKTYDLLKDGKIYIERLINGKPARIIHRYDEDDISGYIDADGYFMFEIYPFPAGVSYYDENGEQKGKGFNVAFNKSEYTKILKEEVIPFCDDLLARGLISREYYDLHTVKDPLDYYIKMFNFE